MRDAFGGAFMIKLMLIFLTVYIAFMAVAINYAKAFRVKNQIINIIEQYEGYDKRTTNNEEVKDIISRYVQQMSYNVQMESIEPTHENGNKECESNGYCVTTVNTTGGTYYIVETFIHLELPFSLPFLHAEVTIPVNGETKIIKNLLD